MKIAHNHVTMDGEELQLLERYEEQFGETPPIYFLAPETSHAYPVNPYAYYILGGSSDDNQGQRVAQRGIDRTNS